MIPPRRSIAFSRPKCSIEVRDVIDAIKTSSRSGDGVRPRELPTRRLALRHYPLKLSLSFILYSNLILALRVQLAHTTLFYLLQTLLCRPSLAR